ncbi:hypothetical protein DSL72_006740 [Monilinia vaccinii-corymbosi]|uniref:Tat pathway signal sequence n=1 Tax=Monilinia vaccinii-corymbosi TaxID=61207 RepID=A0A8A3PN06_9HELO|nr:hypothetical protein DSL72_006740 [Monilinia vaccinii-corymbosi]
MEKISETYQRPLLDQCSEVYDDGSYENHQQYHQRSLSGMVKNALQIVAFLLLLYISILLTIEGSSKWTKAVNDKEAVNEQLTLPQKALKFEQRPEWLRIQPPWNQPPSDEVDSAWDELLFSLNIRISSEELSLLNENKTNLVRVTGGDHGKNYVGVIGVYHHIHCLNNIRRMLSWDYYEPKFAHQKHTEGFSKEHAHHCLDTIRQALMCHANTALYTSEWDSRTHMPSRDLRSGAVTTCVQWDSLDTWARQRALVPGHYKYIATTVD